MVSRSGALLRLIALLASSRDASAVHAWPAVEAPTLQALQAPQATPRPAGGLTAEALPAPALYRLGVSRSAPAVSPAVGATIAHWAVRRFFVPWWGWLVLAGLLFGTALLCFGLGAWAGKRVTVQKLEKQASEDATSGFSALKKSVAERWARAGSKDTRDASKEPASAVEEPPPPIMTSEEASAGSQAGKSAEQKLTPHTPQCYSCLPPALQCSTLLTKAVRKALNSIDVDILGVPVTTGSIRIARSGMVEVSDLVLGNPEGYHSDFFLRIKKVALQVAMTKYILSRGKQVVVDQLIIEKIEVNYEKALLTSNVDYVVNFLSGEQQEECMVTSVLSAVGDTGSAVSNAAGATLHAAGLTPTALRRNSANVGRAVGVPLALQTGVDVVANTTAGILDTAAGVAGAAAFAGSSVITGSASAVRAGAQVASQTALSGMQGVSQVAALAAGATGAASSNEPMPKATEPAAKAPQSQASSDQWLVLKRLQVSEIEVTLASNMVAGAGLTVACGGLDYENFTEEMSLTGGIEIVKFLLKMVLLSAIKSVTHVGKLSLETTSGCVKVGKTLAEEVTEGTVDRVNRM